MLHEGRGFFDQTGKRRGWGQLALRYLSDANRNTQSVFPIRARWLSLFANLLVVGYALDAGLSLVEQILRSATGSGLLMGLRNGLAGWVLALALLGLPLVWITPRLPLRLFLPLILSAVWLNTGAVPLPIAIASRRALEMTCVLLQASIALAAMLWIRRRNSEQGWLFGADAFAGRPFFSLSHTALATLATLFVLVPATAFYGFLSLATYLQLGTQGFVSFDLSGVSLADRRYIRDDREVRLVAMMHIGQEQAYRELVRSFIDESTIVLAEGVSDQSGLIEVPLSYEAGARALGLAPQEDLRSYLVDPPETLPEWPVVRNADLDMSDFSVATIEFIEWAAQVWEGSGPIDAIRTLMAHSTDNAGELASVEHDLIGLRNEHLLREIDAALPDYQRVIVPWGALHLPAIERSILGRGFDESQRDRYELISWMTLVAALF